MIVASVETLRFKNKNSETFGRSWNDQKTEIKQLRLIICACLHLIKSWSFNICLKQKSAQVGTPAKGKDFQKKFPELEHLTDN